MSLCKTLSCGAARESDAAHIAELFRLVYGRSSHPCKDPHYIDALLRTSGNVWQVAKDGEDVVASMALIAEPANRSAQLSYGVTLPAFRDWGLGTKLAQGCLAAACATADCHLIYGFPRNATMYRILNSVTLPRMQFVGDDGAINVANGRREYHGLICTRTPEASFRHVLPKGASLAASAFVRDRVLSGFGSAPEFGEYPQRHIAASAAPGHSLGGIQYAYDPACPSASVEILGCSSNEDSSAGAHATITQFLDKFAGIQHARITVLADKWRLIAALLDSGFRIAAYLPAWFYESGARFDCVLLVRAWFSEKPVIHGIEDLIHSFRSGYAGAAEECGILPTR